MVITFLYGGLGNQMFQYALGKKLAHRHQTVLKLDNSWFQSDMKGTASREFELNYFTITASAASEVEIAQVQEPYPFLIQKIVNRISSRLPYYKRRIVQEQHFHFDPNILRVGENAYLHGYWQSEKYFADVRDVLLREFSFRAPLDSANKQIADIIGKTESVSLHVRRADYVSSKEVNRVLGVCPPEYYTRAVQHIRKNITHPVFFVFSDDIEWCRQNLSLHEETHFIDHNTGANSYRDMQLMSLCRHNIVANSSFSWWGAWLNQNADKIAIAPQRWFADTSINDKDLIPENWLRL